MTLEITVLEIAADAATNHAQGVVHRLFDTGYRLPDEIRDDILALGQAAVPALLERPVPLRVGGEVQEVLPGQGTFDKHAITGFLHSSKAGRHRGTVSRRVRAWSGARG